MKTKSRFFAPIMSEQAKSSLFNLKDLVAYFLVAGTGAVVQLGVGSFLRQTFSYRTSVALGYIASFVVGFILTKLFAFDVRNTAQTQREMIKFGMVSILSYFITVEGSVLLLSIITTFWPNTSFIIPLINFKINNVNEFLATLTAMGLSFINNYILHKTFTFKSTGFYNRVKDYLKM
jgi:putative flippase GtrA